MSNMTRLSRRMRPSLRRATSVAAVAMAVAFALSAGGCIAGAVGALGEQIERGKKLDVPAQYDGLEGRSVAVIVNADYATLVEHPTVAGQVTANVSARIARFVKGASVLAPTQVLEWQYRTPQWRAMPYGEIAKELGVDRLVHIDLYEYRLNPVGNSYLWDGVGGANIGVIEADGLAPDEFVFSTNVVARFPDQEGVGRESARAEDIERGLLTLFIQRASWLFYRHIEDKYPSRG